VPGSGLESESWFLNGSMDELLVFNRQLSASEARTLYGDRQGRYGSADLLPWSNGLVAGYHFDEGTGTSAADFSGNGHNGALQGASWTPSSVAVGAPGKSATLTWTFSTVGTHRITAAYSGDGVYPASTSAPLDLVVRISTGNVYYVDPQGIGGPPSDSNPGTTIAQPLATFWKARDLATNPGDTIILRGGTYNMVDASPTLVADGYNTEITVGGAAGEPISYTSYPGETPVLDLSQQEPWTLDSGNGWWTAELSPNSVVARGITAARGIFVFRHDGQLPGSELAVPMGSLSDFLNPPSQFVSGGVLTQDLSYYDVTSGTVYFRPSVPLVGDPYQTLRIVSSNCQFYIAALGPLQTGSYITVSGLTVQFAWDVQASHALGVAECDHLEFLDNTITNCCNQGLAVCATNSVITGNFVDRVGGQYHDDYSPSWLEHCLYYSGHGMTTIEDNFFGRCYSGDSVTIHSDVEPMESVWFDHNVVYNEWGTVMNVADNAVDIHVDHNVIISTYAPGVDIGLGVNGITFADNYVECGSSGGACLHLYDGVDNFHIIDNVINAYDELTIEGTGVVMGDSLISENTWLSNGSSLGHWSIHIYGSTFQDFYKYDPDYLNWVSANEPTWEQNSTWSRPLATLPTDINYVLDAQNFEQACLELRQYAESNGFTS